MLNHIKEVLAESTGLHCIWGENSAFYTQVSCSSWSSWLDILRAYFGKK